MNHSLVIGRLYQTIAIVTLFDLATNHNGQWAYSEGIGDDAVETNSGTPILIIDYMYKPNKESNGIYIGLLNERTVIVYANDVKVL